MSSILLMLRTPIWLSFVKGLQDIDSYARRRAILSLARLTPKDARQLADQFLRDEDPYIRQAASELLKTNS
jgi:HEAT repeat protein